MQELRMHISDYNILQKKKKITTCNLFLLLLRSPSNSRSLFKSNSSLFRKIILQIRRTSSIRN